MQARVPIRFREAGADSVLATRESHWMSWSINPGVRSRELI